MGKEEAGQCRAEHGRVAEFLAALSLAHTVKVDPPNPLKLTFTLNATAGTFSGSVAPPGGTKKVTFSGVLQQRAVQAAGFFLGLVVGGEGQSGTVSLGPLP